MNVGWGKEVGWKVNLNNGCFYESKFWVVVVVSVI